jgi:hypothetical protein
MNNKTLAIVLVVIAVGVLGFAGFKMFGPKPAVDTLVKCEKCKAVETTLASPSATFPIACPKCKEAAAHPAFKYKCINPQCEISKLGSQTFIDKELVKDEKTKSPICVKCKQSLDVTE